jgi:hypothetical protein
MTLAVLVRPVTCEPTEHPAHAEFPAAREFDRDPQGSARRRPAALYRDEASLVPCSMGVSHQTVVTMLFGLSVRAPQLKMATLSQ